MPGVQSPTVRRRRLGQELRRLHEAARLTIDEVAQRLEVSPAKISRIETGRVSLRPRDVSDLLDQYEVYGTHRDNLLTLTREARQRGWWHSYSDVLSEGTDIWVGLETEAEAIRSFEVQVVPGLLRTSEYARAVLRAYYRSEPSEQIERRVRLRMARQQLVIEQNNSPIWAVLDEAVLRRHIGPPEVMESQYRRHLEFSEENNITIQVPPLDAGVYRGIPVGFGIMQLPHPNPEVVAIEHRGGILYVERSEDVAVHADVFEWIRATAKGRRIARAHYKTIGGKGEDEHAKHQPYSLMYKTGSAMTSLPYWPYGQVFDTSTLGQFSSKIPNNRAELIKLVRIDIKKNHALSRQAIRAEQRARVLAMWLSFSLALLMIATAIFAIYLGREIAAAASVFGVISSVCWGILMSWKSVPGVSAQRGAQTSESSSNSPQDQAK